jgi:hypothetical protein
MASSGMLRRVALVRTDVSGKLSASIIKVTTANVGPSSQIRVILIMEALHFPETSVLIRATWRNIPQDAILLFRLALQIENYNETYCSRADRES